MPCRKDHCGTNDLPGMEFVHGSPLDEDEYLLTTATADDNLELPGHSPLIFFGHTHIQGGFIDEDGESRPFRPLYDSVEGPVQYTMWLTPGERYLINPGSVGQPRDSDWRAAFALYEQQWRAAGECYVLSRALRHRASPAAHPVGAIARPPGSTPEARAIAALASLQNKPQFQRFPIWNKLLPCLSVHFLKNRTFAARSSFGGAEHEHAVWIPGCAHRWRSARKSRPRGIRRGDRRRNGTAGGGTQRIPRQPDQ